jgi:hypothetical protein
MVTPFLQTRIPSLHIHNTFYHAVHVLIGPWQARLATLRLHNGTDEINIYQIMTVSYLCRLTVFITVHWHSISEIRTRDRDMVTRVNLS